MRRWLIILGVVVVLLASVYFALQQNLFPLPMSQATPVALQQTDGNCLLYTSDAADE